MRVADSDFFITDSFFRSGFWGKDFLILVFNGCITFIGTLETSRVRTFVFGEYFSLVTVRCDLSGGARYLTNHWCSPKFRAQCGHSSESIGLDGISLSSTFSPLFFICGKYAAISVPSLRCLDESNGTFFFLAFFWHIVEWRCNKFGRNERLHIMHGTFVIVRLVHFWKVDFAKDGNYEIMNSCL
ncbi:hypothetical protein AGLY_015025 [Aphis glycines]|uniref:Uncharacterized protein n=1 Tax=Aphis glycines TaxID=307491 RepID=A0A6G0T3Q9_APHGL|nr:hypothetical protein AGLY_015025 [Aphis glycines]